MPGMLLKAAGLLIAQADAALGPTVVLRGNVTMPSIGLGSSGGCGPDSFGTDLGEPCGWYNASMQWFQLGGRAAHDALSYGNQYGLGKAAADFGREKLFLMSMVPKYLMGYNETKLAVQASLEQMGLDGPNGYLDLVMVHHRAADVGDWPRSANSMKAFPNGSLPWMHTDGHKTIWGIPPCAQYENDPTGNWLQCQDQTWQALVELKKAGKIRAIGVSNWQISNLERMAKLGQELPAVNQIEAHLGYHEDDLIQWCHEHDIVVQAATPLARKLPALVSPAGQKGSLPAIADIATKYGKTPAQVSLRFLIEKGVAAIPSTTNETYQKENLDVFSFQLTDEEMGVLNRLALPCRGDPALGLQKCWADPGTMMCMDSKGNMFHCP